MADYTITLTHETGSGLHILEGRDVDSRAVFASLITNPYDLGLMLACHQLLHESAAAAGYTHYLDEITDTRWTVIELQHMQQWPHEEDKETSSHP